MQAGSCQPQVPEEQADFNRGEVCRESPGSTHRTEFPPADAKGDTAASPRPPGVEALEIGNLTVVYFGRWFKIAEVDHEQYLDLDIGADVESLVTKLKAANLGIDIFTFTQKLPDIEPKHSYYMEWDNLAAIPITGYSEWLEKQATYDVRYRLRRWQRDGLELRKTELDDAFIHGVCKIYNESPVRQGKAFFYYHWDFERARREQTMFGGRTCVIGAYLHGELIGFIRMVYIKAYASVVDVLSLIKHRRMMPNNALIAKAVEICAQEGLSHFVYGRYVYNNPASSLTAFKRRNGFQQVMIPKYYVPLTLKGALALKLRLHRRLVDHVPMSVRPLLHRLRTALTVDKR